MPIFLWMTKQLQTFSVSKVPTVSKAVRAAAVVGMAAMAFVAPPPQGFKVSDLAAGMTSPGRFDSITSVVKPVIAQVFFVMFSAAMLGLAQLVYTHFMKKWEQKGLAVLPINVLRPGAASASPSWSPGATQFQPGFGAQAPQARQAAAPTAAPQAAPRTSPIDEYKD